DGKLLAIGYNDAVAVDILDGTTFARVEVHKPAAVVAALDGTNQIAWSRDGQTLFAAGAVMDAQDRRLLFAWDRTGLGDEQRMTYCAPNTAAGIDTLQNGQILVATMMPSLCLMNADGHPVWTASSRIFDFRDQGNALGVSIDASLVEFVHRDP